MQKKVYLQGVFFVLLGVSFLRAGLEDNLPFARQLAGSSDPGKLLDNFTLHFESLISADLSRPICQSLDFLNIDFETQRVGSFSDDVIFDDNYRMRSFDGQPRAPAKVLFTELFKHCKALQKELNLYFVEEPEKTFVVIRKEKIEYYPFYALQSDKLSYYECIILYKRLLQGCDCNTFHEDWKSVNSSLNKKLASITSSY